MTVPTTATWRATVVGVAAVSAVVLLPDPVAWRAALAPRSGPVVHVDDLAVLLAGAALWLLATWVLTVAALAAVAALPGRCGRLGRLLVRATVPRVLRGVVLGGIAGGLVLGPALTANAVPVWPTGPPVSTAATTPGPAWPTTPPAATPPAATPPAATPPAATPPTAAATPSSASPTTAPPDHSAPAARPAPTSTTPDATDVVVAAGDSLWSISTSALTPPGGAAPTDRQVAAAWPAWFAVNRAVIGPDPGLLRPGTHLAPPTTDGSTP